MSKPLVILVVLVAVAAFVALGSGNREQPLESVPDALFADWRAQDGPHAGRELLLSQTQVRLRSEGADLEGGPLIGIYAVATDGGYAKYRIEFGTQIPPSAITVMLDAAGGLRLANSPGSQWLAKRADDASPSPGRSRPR